MAKYFVGIDWGKEKCGMALADDETRIATGSKLVKMENILSELQEMKNNFLISKVIIGFSDFGENKKKVENLIEKIREKGFVVEKEREDFSTKMAHSNLKEAGFENLSKKDDVESARIILQSWLDRN